ncbi:TonB-dependent receptor [Novosphingobium panipatense]|uniref:Iron complex outermembrane recepter protein n=1 Tax=Novosphingobium panipatense TaxID=428991 RepID=A0ABY1Q3C4_9SPHN|nr:TonB-dependent receptor [Novosphingobium panipatense]SMP57910.1 iron complex outermembrane recepter protein [Novosphingobium panipatense]
MRYRLFKAALLACASLGSVTSVLPSQASAQEVEPRKAPPPPDVHEVPHPDREPPVQDSAPGRDIVVVGHPPTDFGLLSATASLAGDALLTRIRGQIGETLSSLPGVSSTAFAPGASRPVLRGFSGDRVSVMIDGIGSLDASNISVDHAVVFDPLTIDHVDVFHGPSVLLYGGNAIGGAVNAIDKRIPRQVPDRITATGIGGYGTAADERSLSGAIEAPLGDRFVAHADASWRKADDLRVGGKIYSPALREDMRHAAEHLREEGEEGEATALEAQTVRSGRLTDSAARTLTLGAGLAFIDADGNLGISYQHYDTRYGVPSRPETGHGHEEDHEEGHDHGEGPVSIGLKQDRFDLRGEVRLSGFLESLQVRGAYADYRHTEFEGSEVGTVFEGEGIETRLDLIQATRNGWRGRSGVQYLSRSLVTTGPEAVVPDYRIDRVGVFTLQSLDLGAGFTVDASGRYDSSRATSRSGDFSRSYDLASAAAGASWRSGKGFSVGANFVHGERAPSPEELLSDGLHVATQAYEVGDRALDKERSDAFEAYVRYRQPSFEVSLTGYLSDFDNYITPLATGEEEQGQPVYRYTGVGARFRGFEASGSVRATRWDGGELRLDALADYTHAQIKGHGPVPRIPPLRLRGGATATFDTVRLRGELEWNARQNRVGPFENATAAFTVVNVSADWHPMGEDGPVTLMLSADNLFDVIGRRAASFTSDFVPIAGRDVRLTAKFTY